MSITLSENENFDHYKMLKCSSCGKKTPIFKKDTFLRCNECSTVIPKIYLAMFTDARLRLEYHTFWGIK